MLELNARLGGNTHLIRDVFTFFHISNGQPEGIFSVAPDLAVLDRGEIMYQQTIFGYSIWRIVRSS